MRMGFCKFHGTEKTFFLENNILSAKLGDYKNTITKIIAETHI